MALVVGVLKASLAHHAGVISNLTSPTLPYDIPERKRTDTDALWCGSCELIQHRRTCRENGHRRRMSKHA